MLNLKSIALVLLSTLTLVACSSTNTKSVEDGTPEALYTKAQTLFQQENYKEANDYLDAIDTRYPFSIYSAQALLDSMYSNYKSYKYSVTLANAERYLTHYGKTGKHMDFVLYIAGLTNMAIPESLLLTTFGANYSTRDVLAFRNAYTNFSNLVHSFPNSPYVADAKNRMTYLYNLLAAHEYNIAKFYYNRDAYVAVVNRVTNLLRTYPDSRYTYQALPMMINSYKAMGLTKLADDTEKLAQENKDRKFATYYVPKESSDVKLTVPNLLGKLAPAEPAPAK